MKIYVFKVEVYVRGRENFDDFCRILKKTGYVHDFVKIRYPVATCGKRGHRL